MNTKRLIVAGSIVLALGLPAGVAVAATTSPSPSTSTSSTAPTTAPTATPTPGQGYGPGYGPGYGRMMGGTGDPEDCPFYDSAQAQQWRDQRADRQQLMQQMHRNWAATATPSAPAS
jgi:hypothetical protein